MNASRKEKNHAFVAHEKTLSWITQGAESFFHLAGEHELAERIRPSVPRPRRASEEAKAAKDASQDADTSSGEAAEASSGENGTEETPKDDSPPTDSPAPDAVAEPAPPSSVSS